MMSEKKKLVQSIAAFSKKFSKLEEEDKENYEAPASKEKILQDEINRREFEREEMLRNRFSDFQDPRTQDIEQDEEDLLNAWDFYCKLNDFCEASEKEGSTAHLRSMEITSPLCRRDDYTLGDSMAFLRLWFLQKFPDAAAVPEFSRAENGQFYLNFQSLELWVPSSLEKEILRVLDSQNSSI